MELVEQPTAGRVNIPALSKQWDLTRGRLLLVCFATKRITLLCRSTATTSRQPVRNRPPTGLIVMKEKYELSVGGRLGPGPSDSKEVSVLNRILRWTPKGIGYEADPRQVEKLPAEIELEGANGAATPGQKILSHQVETEEELMERGFTRFRGLAARATYLATDRTDVLYAAKEVCRFMSRPTDLAMGALKRLRRYLRARPRMVFIYKRQSADGIEACTDTDWAGCMRTRKSTSGDCLMVGRHLIKAWSATQASLALSSGEAEYHGVVQGVGIRRVLQALYRDTGVALPMCV